MKLEEVNYIIFSLFKLKVVSCKKNTVLQSLTCQNTYLVICNTGRKPSTLKEIKVGFLPAVGLETLAS